MNLSQWVPYILTRSALATTALTILPVLCLYALPVSPRRIRLHLMHGRQDAICHDHIQSGDAEPPLGRLGWAALTAMIYLPAATTVLLFMVGGILCRHGNVPIWNRLLGPVAMISFGWTFLGAGIWDFSHRSTDVLQTGPHDGRSKTARWADALFPVLFGALFMAIGIWILFSRRN